MNPRQRRGVLLTVLAVAGAVAVFLAVAGYVDGVRRQLGEVRQALVLVTDVPAYTAVSSDMVTTVPVPRRFLSSTTLFGVEALEGRVAAASLRQGSFLQADMLAPAPAVQPGEREVTVTFGVDASVSGQVKPDDLVDIYATYKDERAHTSSTRPVVLFARVLQVAARKNAGTDVFAVTFAVSSAESLQISQAAATATALRLALVPPQERAPSGTVEPPPATGPAPSPTGVRR